MNYKNIKRTMALLAVALSSSLIAVTAYSSDSPLSAVVITSVESEDEASDTLLVQGRLDGTIYNRVDINGYSPLSYQGENFTLPLPRSTSYQLKLYGDGGAYREIDYSAVDASVDSAIELVIAHQLSAELGPVLGRLLTDLDLMSVLSLDPSACAVDTFLLRGCDLYLKALQLHGTPDVALSFNNSEEQQLTLDVSVAIPLATLHTQLKRALWRGYRDTMIRTEDITLQLQIGVYATDDHSIKLVLNESSDLNLSVGRMRVDSNALAPYLLPILKEAVVEVIDRHAANAIGPFLGLLPIPAIPLSLPVDIDGDEVDDAEFAINMHAQQLSVLTNGDGMAVLGGSIHAAEVYPGRELLGSRRIGSYLQQANELSAPTDISAVVAVDLANQVLAAVYQSGLEQKLALPMTMESLGDFGKILVGSFGYQADDAVLIRLGFSAPPELLVDSESAFALGIQAGINEMRLQIATPNGDGEEVILDITADVLVDTSLGAIGDGRLQLEFEQLLQLSGVVVNGGSLVDVYQFPPDVLAMIVTTALPGLLTKMEPTINELLNVARLELDIGEMLGGWLKTEFPSVLVEGYITETGVSDDESYIELGIGLDFPL
ncbi:hypothetical protein EDC56_0687 [Sinobacterium caligoides]|uniref:DUF2125 domain-containing protein n=1 Tax=Sinobacterium caligoides TaxID=933926 RepID=A0A3N2DZ78_9GAMM|nr:hypothetical protein [Sinobacterium caligoides]ROS05158.1 hypothetical protein EDC56_0687 [Sinobacterium caligoides]